MNIALYNVSDSFASVLDDHGSNVLEVSFPNVKGKICHC